jgi:hypothetical protein
LGTPDWLVYFFVQRTNLLGAGTSGSGLPGKGWNGKDRTEVPGSIMTDKAVFAGSGYSVLPGLWGSGFLPQYLDYRWDYGGQTSPESKKNGLTSPKELLGWARLDGRKVTDFERTSMRIWRKL